MKKLLSISFFLVFFFSQFGKVVNFCLCSMATYQQTGTVVCDCEKQLAVHIDTDTKKQTHQHPATLPQADELILIHHIATCNFHYSTPAVIQLHSNSEALYDAYCGDIFHPPITDYTDC